MNLILLRPEGEWRSQVVVQDRRQTTVRARDYSRLMTTVPDSFQHLATTHNLVIVRSPAGVNLRAGNIADMGLAAANLPVVVTPSPPDGHHHPPEALLAR